MSGERVCIFAERANLPFNVVLILICGLRRFFLFFGAIGSLSLSPFESFSFESCSIPSRFECDRDEGRERNRRARIQTIQIAVNVRSQRRKQMVSSVSLPFGHILINLYDLFCICTFPWNLCQHNL